MKSLVIANWKMNPTSLSAVERIAKATELSVKKNCQVVVSPPFVFLERVSSLLKKAKLGAQNCSWEKEGSLTGEISPLMLKKMGVSYVIIGHSERRIFFGEDNNIINKKIKMALKEGLSVILCIGETREERNKGLTEKILGTQLQAGLNGVKGKIIVAYEPVWAIGSGDSCDFRIAEKTRIFIEKKMRELLFSDIQILYGGSVNSKNASDYVKQASFSGVLVGGASLYVKEFKKIIDSLS